MQSIPYAVVSMRRREELDASLAQVEHAELVRRLNEDELAYLFKHALVHETAYESLLKQDRKRLHRAAAETLVREYPDRLDENAALLAHHFEQAGEQAQALEYYLRAGAAALRVYALREAFAHFDRALTALAHLPSPAPLQEYDALMGWAEAAKNLQPYREQLEKLARAEQIARELNDKPRLARALYRTGGVYITSGYAFHSLPPLTEVFALADELGDERYAVIPTFSMGLAMLGANTRQALELLNRAIDLAAKYGDQDIEATAWSVKGMAHARLGEFSQARQALARADKLLTGLKSPMTASDVYLFAGWAWLEMGNAESGLEYALRSVETAAATGNRDCECNALDCVGFCELTAQRIPQAKAAFQEAIQHSQYSGAELFERLGRAGLAMTEFYAGRSEAVADLEEAYRRTLELNEPWGVATLAQALGGVYAALGDNERAELFLNKALDYFRAHEIATQLVRTQEGLEQLYTREGRAEMAEQAHAEAAHWRNVMAQASTEAVRA